MPGYPAHKWGGSLRLVISPLRSNFLRASSCGIALKCRRGQTGTVNKTRQILSMMSKAKSTSPAMAFVASGFPTRLSGAFGTRKRTRKPEIIIPDFSLKSGNYAALVAERVGFEPTEGLTLRRFSRPVP
ncbi:hypothetical protein XACW160_310105 [Xanthomonas citri pv. citri]|nr:hypothetical protein XAC1083_260148 [Xanthomonas citri pv. citri]CEE35018.1 hypothetical protein XAC902_330098 [Xanthomonas citri pv. citri]CEE61021.1 hypothetical protein XACW160_310105 [Xanthomonas citri pv. citri]CEE75540.1 hypothetical protein XACLC80_280015 [Xanthomonas citri pv. citri]CEE84526.1 hypothetical protein XAC3218_420095 [Xanthomonas citri pv. citri]